MSERLSQDEVTDLIVAVVDHLAAKGIEAGVSTDYSSGDVVLTVTVEGRTA